MTMKLSTRLLSGFLGIGGLGFAVGLIGFFSLSSIKEDLEDVSKNMLVSVETLWIIKEGQTSIDSGENTLMLPTLTPEQVQDAFQRFDDAMKRIEKAWKRYDATIQMPEEERLWKSEFLPAWKVWMKDHETYAAMAKSLHGTPIAQRTEKQQQDLIRFSLEVLPKSYQTVEDLLTRLTELNSSAAEKNSREAMSEAGTRQALLLVSVFMGLSASAALGIFLARSLSRTLREISNRLSVASDETAAASEQLSAASQRLAEGATEQASSLQETAATVEELNAMIHKSADNAKSASSVVGENRDSAVSGKEAMQNVMQAMSAIETSNANIMNQVKESNEKIGDIVKIINDIGNRTKVINEIVFQTKLLSFNASVEAARAGEHGKGFAVVAEEVGNLAQMSGNAAKEIESMLSGSVARVEGIVTETKSKVEALISEGKLRLEDGRRMVETCDKVLEEIVSGSSRATRMANEVAQGAEQQSHGINEIASAIRQLDQVTQENASTSEESAASAERLSEQAMELRNSVVTLVALVEGGHGSGGLGSLPSVAPRTFRTPGGDAPHATDTHKNVVSIKRAASRRLAAASPSPSGAPLAPDGAGLKNAVGFDGVPSDNDPRFKEI